MIDKIHSTEITAIYSKYKTMEFNNAYKSLKTILSKDGKDKDEILRAEKRSLLMTKYDGDKLCYLIPSMLYDEFQEYKKIVSKTYKI